MSFSSKVKAELANQVGASRHCRLAELAVILACSGKLKARDQEICLTLDTENGLLKEKYTMLLSLLFGINEAPEWICGETALQILESVKIWDKRSGQFFDMETVNGMLIQHSCCRRAFIRGAFLAAGSMSNPNKAYHFEIVCRSVRQAKQIQAAMNRFDVDARVVARKKNQVVYVKEGEHIVDLLNIMEAHVALMDLENVRIVKEMRNFVNRQVNCETANISKTVNAAVRQIEDILYIKGRMGLDALPDHLREIALLRLEYPDMPLKELGAYLNPPVGKSGVNHRLRKISELAAELGKVHLDKKSRQSATE